MYINKEELLNDMKNLSIVPSLDKLSEELKNDPDVIVELIKNDQRLVNKFSDKLQQNSQLMDRVFNEIDSSLYHRLSPELANNKEFMSKVVAVDPNARYHLGDKLRDDVEFKKQCEQIIKNVELNDNATKEDAIIDEHLEQISPQSLEDILGKEKYDLVAYYPETLKKLNEIKNTPKYNTFGECIKNLNTKNMELTEWSTSLNNLIDKFNDSNYNELLTNIKPQNINVEQLNNILEQPNYFNLKNEQEVNDYQSIKQKVCDDIIENKEENIEKFPEIAKMNKADQMKFAVLEKVFGYDIKQSENIAYKFYNLDDVKAKDTSNLKSYVYSLKEILKEKSSNVLKKFYSLEPLGDESKNKLDLEKEVKKLYTKEYNDSLFKPENAKEILSKNLENFLPNGIDKNQYKFLDAGTDFNMIMTSVAPYFANTPENFAKDWNRDVTNSQGFSCSYIGNDMMGTAPIPHLCYGFSNMKEDSLLLAGDRNLGSATNADELKFNETYVNYDTPQELKNSTSEFNEMVFKRTQDGKRKQPDYLIVFKKGDKIENMSKTLDAVEQFKAEGVDLPIVVVDVEKCIESEKQKIDNMLENAIQSGNKEELEAVRQKIRNNSVANRMAFKESYQKYDTALHDVYNNKNKEENTYQNDKNEQNEIKDTKINEDFYQTAYESTTVEERKEEVSKIVRIQREIIKETQIRGDVNDGR